MKDFLSGIAIVLAVVAAALWWHASATKVPYKPQTDDEGWTGASITRNGIDVLETAERQSRINKWAAAAAIVSAVLQAILYWSN